MDTLDKALELLSEHFGDIDNIKLLLGGGEDMTRELVAEELLRIATQLRNGEIPNSGCLKESKLTGSKMAF